MSQIKPWPVLSLDRAHARLTAPGARFETMEVRIRGQTMAVWKHMPATAAELFVQGSTHGPAEFLVYQDQRVSFEGFCRAALAVAAQLQAQGLNKGDRVALAMRNLPEWPVVFFGGLLAGAILVPLNSWGTGAELEHALRDSASRFLFCDPECWQRIAPLRDNCPALEKIHLARGGDDNHAAALENIIGPPSRWSDLPSGAMPEVALTPEDDATIFYTSGTAGRPKGVLGTHRSLTINLPAFAFSMARNALRRGEAPTAPLPRITLLPIPFFHVMGCISGLVAHLGTGGKLVLMRKFEADAALALIGREKINGILAVPSVVMQLLQHPDRVRHDLSSLRALSYGGAPSPAGLAAQIAHSFAGAQASNGWGMTETSATCTTHGGAELLHRPDSCGPPLPIYRVKVTDDSGRRALPAGAVGELWAYGANVAKGYWNDPQASAETFQDGWVRSGDLARLDEDGFCSIIDRAKDMLIRGGENISCREVEQALFDHPAVGDAAVVGLPHAVLGEEPAALVHLRPGTRVSEAALRAHAGARLAAFKVPVKILFWPDMLPRNATGKLVKAELKKLFAS